MCYIVYQKFYTEEKAFIKLQNSSRFGYGFWHQACAGEAAYLVLKMNDHTILHKYF